MRGFTTALQTIKAPAIGIPRCGACGLLKLCQHPKMAVTGEGKRRVLLVGEVPGLNEDAQNKQFVGKAGKFLRRTLHSIGVEPDTDCWFTNAVICCTTTPGGKIRNPTDNEIGFCRPNLTNTLNALKPDVVILLGGVAIKSLIGMIWKEDLGKDSVGKWVGWKIPSHKPCAWICPTWHPSFLVRSDEDPVLVRIFTKHLEDAFALSGKPWGGRSPDYKAKVRVVLNPADAAQHVYKFIDNGKPVAWDLETTTLKPDGPDAEIVCCSVSDGDTSVAFPWHGEAIEATLELLGCEVPKIGFNEKFERRWILAQHGKRVKRCGHDGMLATHVMDNRSGICSLKFQAFVRLGVGPYEEHIKPYFQTKTKSGNEKNRIRECPLPQLLEYCALDSLFEWEVGNLQAREMGIVL